MSIDRKFRRSFVSLILLVSSLSVFVIFPENAKAEPAGNTTLYFTDFTLYDISEDSMYPSMSLTPPTKKNDSSWPPNPVSNTEQWVEWVFIWFTFKELESYNETDFEDFEDLFEGVDLADLLGLYNPFKVTESYKYEGKETLEIDGDVVFNLYFLSNLPSKFFKDSIKVSISYEYSLLGELQFPVEIDNKTGKIKSDLLGDKFQKTIIKIEDVNYDLEPGESLIFSVELMPTEKIIGKIIETQDKDELMEIVASITETLANLGLFPSLGDLASSLDDIFFNESGFNFTVDDIAELANAFRSSSFVYDSISHPSSVALPATISGEDDNTRVYYLHSGNLMNEESPEERNKPLEVLISSVAGNWNGPELERSKILKKATASLFIDHQDLRRIINLLKGKITVTAAIFYGETNIASASNALNRNTLLGLLQKPSEPMMFTFSDFEPHEIEYGKSLSLKVVASKGAILGFRRNAKLLYDSSQYPSSLTVEFDETDHIQMDVEADPTDEKVFLGGSVTYTLNITSDYEEDIEITVYGFSGEEEKWDIELPESFTISEDEEVTKTIVVTSTDDDLNAYEIGDLLEVTFAAEGLTGRDTYQTEIEISKEAVEYDIEVVVPPGKKIRHGENDTYHIKIKNNNTGFFPDTYTINASSEHDWILSIDYKEEEVLFGEETEFEVTVFVPEYTDIESDVLRITIISDESEAHNKDMSVTINITTTVIGPNILEMIYRFFETTAIDLGLDEVLGSYAPHFLAAMVFVMIFFILIILIYFLTIKFVNVVCLDRIKEITPEEEAKFEITIQNPYKRRLIYEIYAKKIPISLGWDVSINSENITLDPKQSQTVTLTVKPTSFVKPDDWAEVKIGVKTLKKHKMTEISTVTTIKDAKPELHITGVYHWPKVFKKGDRVVSSFKLENRGNASANNINVILYIKGKEKNKVEDITISSGGYADIKMPWIAVKGKNEVNIVVK